MAAAAATGEVPAEVPGAHRDRPATLDVIMEPLQRSVRGADMLAFCGVFVSLPVNFRRGQSRCLVAWLLVTLKLLLSSFGGVGWGDGDGMSFLVFFALLLFEL
jgi:hypothetical protein